MSTQNMNASGTSAWSEGYVTEIMYDNYYFPQLSPDMLRTLLLLHGADMPRRNGEEPLRYLELGYGRGLSLNIHSAALEGEFWGTDFNPDHSLYAADVASTAGLTSQLLNQSFAEMDAQSAAGQLPNFDIIVLHGVWSWITDESRRHILNIIHRNLKMGGVVYVSYNALPGWAPLMPLRDLMLMMGDAQGQGVDVNTRVQQAYANVNALAQGGARYFSANEYAQRHLKGMEGKSLAYVSHEYMVRHMRPFYFADMAAALDMVKCTFVTSSQLFTQMGFALPEGTQAMVAGATTAVQRETLRDYCLNQQFRADIFVKGSQRLTPREHMDRMGKLTLGLACQLEAVNLEVRSAQGNFTLKEEIYKPVLAALADQNYKPKSMEELEDHALLAQMESAQLTEAVTVLMAAGYVRPGRCEVPAEVVERCKRLNSVLCQRARLGEEHAALAAPVLGGGVSVSRIEQLFLLSRAEGGENVRHWAEDAYNVLSARGENIMRDDKVLERDEALTEMVTLAERFASERLAFLEAVGAVPSSVEKKKKGK